MEIRMVILNVVYVVMDMDIRKTSALTAEQI